MDNVLVCAIASRSRKATSLVDSLAGGHTLYASSKCLGAGSKMSELPR